MTPAARVEAVRIKFGLPVIKAVPVATAAEVEAAMAHYSWEGVTRPALLPGTIGSDARGLGGALLPLHANFSPDRDLFLKIVAE